MKQYQQILKRETQKYADRYYPYFKMYAKITDFEKHYEQCEFNRVFVEEIITSEGYFLDIITSFEKGILVQYSVQGDLDKASKEYINVLIDRFLKDFKSCFKKEYHTRLKDDLIELHVSFEDAILEDFDHFHQLYEEIKEGIRNEITEEEYLALTNSYKEKQNRLSGQIEFVEKIIESLSA